jgi:nucleotide-binding universal stress UspA family protein
MSHPSQLTMLVPLDGSPQAAAALPFARALAGAGSARLVLVRVVEDPSSIPPIRSNEARAATTYLLRIAAELGGGALSIETRVLIGNPSQEIARAAGCAGPDVVVMATHARGELGRLLLGSVAEQVLVRSSVPVVLVRPGGRRVRRLQTLLVPVDGTRGGHLALAWATRLAREHQAKIELVTVVRGMPGYLAQPLPGLDLGPRLAPTWEAARQDATAMMQRIVERLRRRGFAASGRAVLGHVPGAIVATASEVQADMIVMSTHALAGPARGLLGSVASGVVRDAGRPVLLVRRARRSGTTATTTSRDTATGPLRPC